LWQKRSRNNVLAAKHGVEFHNSFKQIACKSSLSVAGREMRRSDFAKTGKFAAFRRLFIFNFAAVVGFLLGTASFTASMFFYTNPTFAWLFGNCVGGLSHFGANWAMQGQSKKELGKCFIVFNATGILSFLFASGMFAVSEIFIQNSTSSWLLGSVVGTLSHFVMNDKAIKLDYRRGNITKNCD
jgi:hypothetical protein